MTNRLQL